MSNDPSGSDLRTDIVTLTNDILQQQQHAKASGDLSILLAAVASSCKWISNVVRKAELLKVIGVTGTTNVQNENVQKLDILSNEIMCNLLRSSGRAAVLVSEEDEEAIFIEGKERGNYCVCFDPLDGSSNIDCGVSVGTIFGIYRVLDPIVPGESSSKKASLKDVLRPGNELVCAGYCMYGSYTNLVLTFQGSNQVNGYTLDPNIGEFILTHRNIKLGSKKIFSINEGNTLKFDNAVRKYLDEVKATGKYSGRYVGSMVADIHRTLLYGGIFLYPNGKLRVLYECFPMSLLVENAGGKASTGRKRMLDVTPDSIHSRSGIILGTTEEVEKIEKYYKLLDEGKL